MTKKKKDEITNPLFMPFDAAISKLVPENKEHTDLPKANWEGFIYLGGFKASVASLFDNEYFFVTKDLAALMAVKTAALDGFTQFTFLNSKGTITKGIPVSSFTVVADHILKERPEKKDRIQKVLADASLNGIVPLIEAQKKKEG